MKLGPFEIEGTRPGPLRVGARRLRRLPGNWLCGRGRHKWETRVGYANHGLASRPGTVPICARCWHCDWPRFVPFRTQLSPADHPGGESCEHCR